MWPSYHSTCAMCFLCPSDHGQLTYALGGSDSSPNDSKNGTFPLEVFGQLAKAVRAKDSCLGKLDRAQACLAVSQGPPWKEEPRGEGLGVPEAALNTVEVCCYSN